MRIKEFTVFKINNLKYVYGGTLGGIPTEGEEEENNAPQTPPGIPTSNPLGPKKKD